MTPEQALENLINLVNLPEVRLNMADNEAIRRSIQVLSTLITLKESQEKE